MSVLLRPQIRKEMLRTFNWKLQIQTILKWALTRIGCNFWGKFFISLLSSGNKLRWVKTIENFERNKRRKEGGREGVCVFYPQTSISFKGLCDSMLKPISEILLKVLPSYHIVRLINVVEHTHTNTHTHTHARMHARTHARTHAHTHTHNVHTIQQIPNQKKSSFTVIKDTIVILLLIYKSDINLRTPKPSDFQINWSAKIT